MTFRILAFGAILATLAACGTDGAPERPEPRPETGISVTGTVGVGLRG